MNKPLVYAAKIAVVWYVGDHFRVLSLLVDEQELSTLLSGTLNEVICIQVFMGCKGNKNCMYYEYSESKFWF